MRQIYIRLLVVLTFFIPSGCSQSLVQQVASFTPSLVLDFGSGLPAGLIFSRSSIGTYMGISGVMQIAAANVPRIEYDPITHNSRGLLMEGARTNRLLNSATLSTQTTRTTDTTNTLSFYGIGSVTLSGTATGTLSGTNLTSRVSLTFRPTAGTLILTVSGSVTNANLEVGAFATSYIPTTTIAVTRSADSCIKFTGSDWYNQLEGSLVVEFTPGSAHVNSGVYSLNGGGKPNRMDLRFSGVIISLSGIDQVAPASVGIMANVDNRCGFSYHYGNTSLVRNGGTVHQASTMSIPTVTQMQIGNLDGNTVSSLNGHIQKFTYYPLAVPDSYLQSLTN
ncbi:hypothetical protein [Spirosoma flavum]|uniref:Lipoprotein n=1 Tax=Spirosoma flavum TaxID=2048557 RepID=A0ABW6AI89_9BACT